jgi:hypothetical protein
MGKQSELPKCPYCDYRSSDRNEQKNHLIKEHHAKMVEIAEQYNETIEWAVGEGAFLFD